MDTFLSETNTWDSIAVAYDQLNRPVLEVFARSALERVQLDADWRVLDIACGPGTSTMLVSEFVDHVDALESEEIIPGLASLFGPDLQAVAHHVGARNFLAVLDGDALDFNDEPVGDAE